MTPRRAPEAVLVALAEAHVAIYRDYPDGDERLPPDVATYRAAVTPLRTRAERNEVRCCDCYMKLKL
jgi:hypothetical protein